MKKEEPEEELEQNTVLLTEIRDLLRENINNNIKSIYQLTIKS